jgi:hypothetical protein
LLYFVPVSIWVFMGSPTVTRSVCRKSSVVFSCAASDVIEPNHEDCPAKGRLRKLQLGYTGAGDLALMDKKYKVTRVRPVDMFPANASRRECSSS